MRIDVLIGNSDLPHLICNLSSVPSSKALDLSARESVPSQTVYLIKEIL